LFCIIISLFWEFSIILKKNSDIPAPEEREDLLLTFANIEEERRLT
jgi:hypothetical protein